MYLTNRAKAKANFFLGKSIKHFFNKEINHLKGVNFIINSFSLDSAKVYLESNELNSLITDYQSLSSDLNLLISVNSLFTSFSFVISVFKKIAFFFNFSFILDLEA